MLRSRMNLRVFSSGKWGVLSWLTMLGVCGGAQGGEPVGVEDVATLRALGAHIAFLADDLLEGRGAGTTGYELAALYVSAQFRRLGLTPLGESGGWLQTVPLLEARRVGDEARVEIEIEGQSQRLERGVDFVAAPHFLETNAVVKAPLVFVGYGVRAEEQGYDDFGTIDLRGSIAVLLAKAPPKFPSTSLAHHSHPREKMKSLIARGAVGVIQVPTPKDLEEMPWPRRVIQSQFPAMRWTRSDGNPSDVHPESKASVTLSPAGVSKVFAKSPKPVSEILAAAARSEPQAFPLNGRASITTHSAHRRMSSANVLAVLPGSDPKLRGECLVFTAHLDHQGRGPAVKGDAIYNGAYDNAIGIAMMLEVARALSSQPVAPRRSVVFAAVTAEERGLLGSEYLALNFPVAAGRPVANINLDMVLLATATRSFVVLGVEHSSLRGPVESAAHRLGIELLPDPAPERVVFVRSDQYSFIRQGVPAIFPKAAIKPGTTLPPDAITPDVFTKQFYHQPGDDLSLPRDAESSVRFVNFVTDVARQVADADGAPKWNPGDFFGTTFGGKGNR